MTSIAIRGHVLPISEADAARFWWKVDKAGDCWVWTAAFDRYGYGAFKIGGHVVKAHRFAYALAGNDLDQSLMLDHQCHTHDCVNPAHLRQVTNAENGANRAGAAANNLSGGVRGVTWDRQMSRWRAQAQMRGRSHYAGLHDSIESAERAAIQLRIRLGMANASDLSRLIELGAKS